MAESRLAFPPCAGPVLDRPKILLVDDRWENLLATEKVLRPLEADIYKAASGNEALSLVLRHALLTWVEMQLETLRSEEAVAWVRILENVLAVVNASKVEAATNGEWRAVLGRCLRSILHHPGASNPTSAVILPS